MPKAEMDLDDFTFLDEGEADDGGDESDEDSELLADDEADEEEESEQEATPATKGAEEKQEQKPGKKADDAPDWAKKAVIAERRKRQEAQREHEKLQRELAYLKGKVEAVTAKGKEEPEADDPIDYSDIEGWVGRKLERERKQLQEAQTERERKAFDRRAERSEKRARAKYEDYEDLAEQFGGLIGKDPEATALASDLLHEPDPAEAMVQFVKSRDVKDPKVAKLEKQLAELQAKLGGKEPDSDEEDEDDEPPAKPRRSLANARGAGPRSAGKQGQEDDRDFFSSVFSRG
ncbi:MAG: hypothetical protein HC927_01295 [Deltaproteobacteria bacterium]|nr:hypothetical protein [Deltaproteobacteria bacterium]